MLWTAALVLGGLAVVLGVTGSIIEKFRGVRFRSGWLCMVVGLRGGGKSLFVARLIARRIDEGVSVVANFTTPAGPPMVGWEDCILAPARSLVVLDEAHQWARAQAGKSPDPLADWYISHARKLGHEVYVVAQHETQVASFVRNQVNEMVYCEKWAGSLHRARSFSPHGDQAYGKAKAKALWSWWYRPRGRAIEVYDTLDLIDPVESERDTVSQRAAKQQLRGLIGEIRVRRAGGTVEAASSAPAARPGTVRGSIGGDLSAGTMQEPPDLMLATRSSGSESCDGHANSY